MARGRDDDSDEAPSGQRGARWRRDRTEGSQTPAAPEPPEEGPDPDRLMRLRFVFAFVSVLVGSFALLLVGAIVSIVATGRVDLPVALGAVLVSTGTGLLLLRAVLRALMARRPENDELRSLTGFVSLGTGFVLMAVVLDFLFLTVTVMLRGAGEAALFVLPLFVLAYFTLQFLREATDDFLKRTRLARETRLFLTSIAYFALTVLTAQLLFAASVVSPITLVSPADGSVVPAGTLIDLAIDDPSVTQVTYNRGGGENPLPEPYDINTSGWGDGDYTLAIRASAADGSTANITVRVTIDSTPPSVQITSPANNSQIPASTPIEVAAGDAHLSSVRWHEASLTPPEGIALSSPYTIDTGSWPSGSFDVTVTATDAAGNRASASIHVTRPVP